MMKWFEIIELICTIISTIGIIFSAIIMAHHFLKNINIYVSYENKHIKIFATALYKQLLLKKIEIKAGKTILNENDVFFANGNDKIALDTNQMIIIKELNNYAMVFNSLKIGI